MHCNNRFNKQEKTPLKTNLKRKKTWNTLDS
jgi:hypothetical protein